MKSGDLRAVERHNVQLAKDLRAVHARLLLAIRERDQARSELAALRRRLAALGSEPPDSPGPAE